MLTIEIKVTDSEGKRIFQDTAKVDDNRSETEMDAYYYGFEKTGVEEIDRILSAVACAGKAYHSTSGWWDDCICTPKGHEGKAPVDWIQNAANDAAKRWIELRKKEEGNG